MSRTTSTAELPAVRSTRSGSRLGPVSAGGSLVAGDEIPLAARLISVADAFDAMAKRQLELNHAILQDPAVASLSKNLAKSLAPDGILVNTSYNVRSEPIVCTPEDAYRCFMRTGIDLLVANAALPGSRASK